ncbi:MAG TPA: 30S ribosomal protein S6 [Anaerohalosphaeraceae bacterium]|nr:30S ribosomal protein S6 [Anaerohalosphaeraceae bacterium]HOL31004.1 30S ribosomal protein S6 [Anaerohalosphaeraceae bacterium]HPO69088.1 30S ribosomal protein S6 [Anaerohalosphaeraceae bacterium]
METAVKRLYEGMFLVDSALAAQDWQGIIDEVQHILKRADAEIVSLKKWDERRLCYEIQRKSRGTYILAYFNCPTDKVKGIERDVQLSERILRALILRTDGMTQQDIEKPTPAEMQPAQDTSDKPAEQNNAEEASDIAEETAETA